MTRPRQIVFVAWALGGLCSCAPPPTPTPPTGQVQFQILRDRALHTFVQSFQIVVLQKNTTSGSVINCNDFPSNGSVSDPQLIREASATIPWNQQQTEATSEKLRVHTGSTLLFVVEGLANASGSSAPAVIGRGCTEKGIPHGIAGGQIAVDVKAAVGAPCTSKIDCETHLDCHIDPGLSNNGYCTVQGCAAGAACPPGSQCVADQQTSGICARICEGTADCDTSNAQTCEKRISPQGTCDHRVCVNQLWNSDSTCK